MAGRPARLLNINRGQVRALLTGPELEQATRTTAGAIASLARAIAPLTPYDALDVTTTSTRRGGAGGDRAQAHVVIGPSREKGWRDRTRFEQLLTIARRVAS